MKILQVVGYKNAGKTTLTVELIRSLTARGLRIGTVKHDGHDFEPDAPGKDTWRHRQAGAHVTAISSAHRTAWYVERPTEIAELLGSMRDHGLDGVIAEGFKTAPYPKIVLLRDEGDADLLQLPNLVAAAVREQSESVKLLAESCGSPLFVYGSDNNDALLKYIVHWFKVSE
ncbi:molybdopterin-guanine dinucleotide biosynthesis protein B [Cohnella kolymensis]|uniref:molybdopterin-guanine dinucleotide biosynthesis protein B n=1 Tax=Cohnella kolymensis TaxID=1590652 RepID=UPI0006986A17|nr:molybdopterin-guanine dinucleotide biosynthesis protein B [Cohnella kolymensis]